MRIKVTMIRKNKDDADANAKKAFCDLKKEDGGPDQNPL